MIGLDKTIGFLEKHLRVVCFLLSVVIEAMLLTTLFLEYSRFNTTLYMIVVALVIMILICIIGQLKFYKKTGSAYLFFSLPPFIIGCCSLLNKTW